MCQTCGCSDTYTDVIDDKSDPWDDEEEEVEVTEVEWEDE